MTFSYDMGVLGFTKTNPGSVLKSRKLLICGITCPCDSNSHSQHPPARSSTYALTSASCEGFLGLIRLLITFYHSPLSGHIPVRAFTLRAYSRLFVNILRNPLVSAPFTSKACKLDFHSLCRHLSLPILMVYHSIISFYNILVKGY